MYTCRPPCVFQMRFGFILLLSPPFGSPFTPSPHTPLLSSCLSCLLPSCLGASSLTSFARTFVQPLVCTRAFTSTPNPGFRLLRFDNEAGFIVCPCARGSSSSQPRALLSCLARFHVFILLSLLRAHMHISPRLSSSRLPLWEACVCV